jgi:predicted Zn-dependent protease
MRPFPEVKQTMRSASKFLIFILISTGILGACSTSSTGRSQLVLKSDAALAQEGARQFAIIRAKMPMVQDRATIVYVACVADAIVGVLEGDDAAMYWELAVIDQQDINAFVLPGGKISVFAGILTVAVNQNQLATVMGHEVAHVTEKHANERASRASVTGFGVDIASILLGGGYSDQTRAANQALGTGAMLGILNPFSRKQESEADIVGLHFMAKAGFDPRESVDLWQNMNKKNETQVPEFMSTHPSGDTRIEQLVAALPEALAYYNEAKAQGKEPNCVQ